MCQALFRVQHKMRTERLLPQTIWCDQTSTVSVYGNPISLHPL